MKHLALLAVAVIISFSAFTTSCTYENLTSDNSNTDSSGILHREQQEIDAYAKAIRKLPLLYSSISTRGAMPTAYDKVALLSVDI